MVGQKYDRRAKNKKYTTPCPNHGMWGSRKTSSDGSANKKRLISVFSHFEWLWTWPYNQFDSYKAMDHLLKTVP